MSDPARRLLQERQAPGDDRRELDRAPPRHRAEPNLAVLLANVRKRRDPVEIDERGRPRQPEVQERHQALTSGKNLGVAAVAAERRHRLVESLRRVVLEFRRFHCSGVLEAALYRGWPEKDASGSDTPVLTLALHFRPPTRPINRCP